MNHEQTPHGSPEHLVLTLLDTAARVERRLDRTLSGVRGISFSEYRLLLELSRCPSGAATRVALAEAVGLTPSAVTRALKPLEKLGIVATERSDRDARRSLASLTPAGEILLADARQALADAVRGMPLEDDGSVLAWLRALGGRWSFGR